MRENLCFYRVQRNLLIGNVGTEHLGMGKLNVTKIKGLCSVESWRLFFEFGQG